MESFAPCAEPAPAFEPGDFPLAPARTTAFMPVLTGLMAGLLLALEVLKTHLPEWTAWGGGALAAIGVFTLLQWLAVSRVPDRLRVAADALLVLHGPRVLRRLELRKLREVQQVDTAAGPVLLLTDARSTLTLAAGRLADPAQYERLAACVVDAIAGIDPSGELGRRAVQTGRRRLALWQRPVRATWILCIAMAAGSLLRAASLSALAGRPFPLEAAGAFSAPLAQAGELWRLVSWPFVHADVTYLLVDVWALVWIGSYLEKLLGWERVLAAFAAGAAAGAAAWLPLAMPLALSGAGGGVFGLLGLLLAATAGRGSRDARAMLPMPGGWFAMALAAAALALVMPRLPALALVPHRWLGGLVPMAGGLAGGLLVGLVLPAEAELPAPGDARRGVRPWGVLAALALVIGLAGTAMHPRLGHAGDDEAVAQALLALPPAGGTAVLQNDVAYTMLVQAGSGPQAWDIAERLATRAVEQTGRREPALLDTLAVARYRQGDREGARVLLHEALQLARDAQLKALLQRRMREVDEGRPLSPDPTDP